MKEIKSVVQKAEEFLLNTVSVPKYGYGIKKCSEFHDVKKYPDMMLPATYNATNALVLTGAYEKLSKKKKENIVNFINSFQCKKDGRFRFKNMKKHEVYKVPSKKNTWEYIDFHITNYCIGALDNLGAKPKYKFEFVEKYNNLDALEKWISERDMRDPWLEGNCFVNLACFYILKYEKTKKSKYAKLLKHLIDWHKENQDPNTGYWGTNHPKQPASLLFGMAGAAHNYHIYYYMNEPIDYYEKVIDHCIEFMEAGVQSACIDIDVVDVLANFIKFDYRKQDILDTFETFLPKLLKFQNKDGGFPDTHEGIRRMDGWVEGYWEPQGYSNCFATWFRLATIGMIDCTLNPSKQDKWHFRNTIGIGYFNKNYLN